MTARLTLTDAGAGAIADGANVGTQAVTFTRLALGSGTGMGDQSARTLLESQQDIEDVTGSAATPRRIAIRADFVPSAGYAVTEVGLFGRVGAGVEFLVSYWIAASAADAVATAATGTTLVIAGIVEVVSLGADIVVAPALNIAIGVPADVVRTTDHATVDQRGIVELATVAEARAGTDTKRAVTAQGLEARLGDIPAVPNADTSRRGIVELATVAEARAGVGGARALTPEGGAAAVSDGLGTLIPPGTRMVFHQASAPAGWTKSASADDRLLRVVSGDGGGAGGTWVLDGLAVGGTALTVDQLPAHEHADGSLRTTTAGAHSHTTRFQRETSANRVPAVPIYEDDYHSNSPLDWNTSVAGSHSHGVTGATGSTGGGNAHSHPIASDGTWRPAHADVIICARD